jgi:hypothetical protein
VDESWTEDGRRVYGERVRSVDWRGGKNRMRKSGFDLLFFHRAFSHPPHRILQY